MFQYFKPKFLNFEISRKTFQKIPGTASRLTKGKLELFNCAGRPLSFKFLTVLRLSFSKKNGNNAEPKEKSYDLYYFLIISLLHKLLEYM